MLRIENPRSPDIWTGKKNEKLPQNQKYTKVCGYTLVIWGILHVTCFNVSYLHLYLHRVQDIYYRDPFYDKWKKVTILFTKALRVALLHNFSAHIFIDMFAQMQASDLCVPLFSFYFNLLSCLICFPCLVCDISNNM